MNKFSITPQQFCMNKLNAIRKFNHCFYPTVASIKIQTNKTCSCCAGKAFWINVKNYWDEFFIWNSNFSQICISTILFKIRDIFAKLTLHSHNRLLKQCYSQANQCFETAEICMILWWKRILHWAMDAGVPSWTEYLRVCARIYFVPKLIFILCAYVAYSKVIDYESSRVYRIHSMCKRMVCEFFFSLLFVFNFFIANKHWTRTNILYLCV